jgi:hypothetical protein
VIQQLSDAARQILSTHEEVLRKPRYLQRHTRESRLRNINSILVGHCDDGLRLSRSQPAGRPALIVKQPRGAAGVVPIRCQSAVTEGPFSRIAPAVSSQCTRSRTDRNRLEWWIPQRQRPANTLGFISTSVLKSTHFRFDVHKRRDLSRSYVLAD